MSRRGVCPFRLEQKSVAVELLKMMSPFVKLSSLPSLNLVQSVSDRSKLVRATKDRAVLLVHTSDHVLVHHLHVSCLIEVHKVQADISMRRLSDEERKDKFLPDMSSALSFHDRVRDSRPPGVSWLTWMAMGGEVTGSFLADAMSFVFDETSHLKKTACPRGSPTSFSRSLLVVRLSRSLSSHVCR